ncbi:hypothetical protein SAE01_16300 [Segetibacter aerophilus]|uniref:histidine kinase n=1 Tax=Segetibacter aerophilus TaxID=670293 RepID=A0A512BAX3_9BACT|nr:hypothetical protein SAE01_16300 [Segetibacter aerophilus]
MAICTITAYNQNIDSLRRILHTSKQDTTIINTLNVISVVLSTKGNYENALKYAKEALTRATKAGFKKGIADAYFSLGWYYKVQLNYSEAFKNYFTSLTILTKTGDKKSIADMYLNIAGLYFNQGNYGEHLKNQYEALKLYEQIDYKPGIGVALHGMGSVYLYLKNEEEALKYFKKALEIFEETGERFGIAQSSNSIGKIYADQGKYLEALKLHLAAKNIFEEPGAPSWGVPFSYSCIGDVYKKQGERAFAKKDTATAIKMFSKGMENYFAASVGSEKAGNKLDVAQSYIQLGEVNLKLSRFVQARQFLEKALLLSKSLNDKETTKDAYYNLFSLDSAEKKTNEALDNYKKYILYRDNLINEENIRKALQAKVQYGLYKEELEEQQKKSRRFFSFVLLGFLVIVSVLIAFIQWRNNKQKQKANVLLTKQKEEIQFTLAELKATQAQLVQREKLASLGQMTAGIAHEIENPLNFVNNFSEINTELLEELQAQLSAGNAQEALSISNYLKENERKINDHGKRADSIVKGMLQHSRVTSNKKELTNINDLANEYLRLSVHSLRAKDNTFNVSIETNFDDNIEELLIVPQDIGRVLINIYNNAFYSLHEKAKQYSDEYVPKLWITTKGSVKNGELKSVQIRIKDNGMGIPDNILDKIYQPFFTTKPTGQGTGLGLSLSYDIITNEHNGELKVQTSAGEYAEFIIELPKK